jgi:hypothetical protein
MRLIEIKQHEIATLSRRSQKWADEQVNLSPQKASVDLNDVLSGYMEERGLNFIGSGAFSVVYGRPESDRVVKVSHKRDICWYRFADWAMRHQNNPHVPIIYHLESYSITSQKQRYGGRLGRKQTVPIFFAVMERLEPYRSDKLNPNIDPSLLAYFDKHFGINVGTTRLHDAMGGMDKPYHHKEKQGWRWNDPDFQKKYNKYERKYYTKLGQAAKPGTKHPFVKAFREVERKWKSCKGDLHAQNLMIRPSTGELVIVDPIADTTSL